MEKVDLKAAVLYTNFDIIHIKFTVSFMMHRRKYCEIRFNWNNDGSGFVFDHRGCCPGIKQPGMGSAIGGGAEGMMGEIPR